MTATCLLRGVAMVEPRFGTPRGDRETLGPKVAEYARRELGLVLMPWQRHVLDVALELNDRGNFVYRQIGVTVARQNGKTTLVLPWVCWRMERFGGRQRSIYTAQDGVSAREKFVTEYVELLRASPLKSRIDIRLANGSESVTWMKQRSMFGIKAPTRKAGHGSTLDMVVGDEIFAHEDDRLVQALAPTMRTRRSPQFLLTSTAGDEKSRFLWSILKAGRAAHETGDHGSIAYFEFSAPSPLELGIEEHGDVLAYLGEPDVWAQANPALGHTISLDTIRHEWDSARRTQDGVEQFMRATCNMWPRHPVDALTVGWQLFGVDDWSACSVPALEVAPAIAVGVCVVDRQWSLSACQLGGDRSVVDFVASGVGIDRVVAEVKRIADRGIDVTVGIDPSTTAGTVLADLQDLAAKDERVSVRKLGRREAMQACMRLVELVKIAGVGVLDSEQLTSAAAGVVREGTLGELWEFNRSPVTAPLVAAALALAAAPTLVVVDPNEVFVH